MFWFGDIMHMYTLGASGMHDYVVMYINVGAGIICNSLYKVQIPVNGERV